MSRPVASDISCWEEYQVQTTRPEPNTPNHLRCPPRGSLAPIAQVTRHPASAESEIRQVLLVQQFAPRARSTWRGVLPGYTTLVPMQVLYYVDLDLRYSQIVILSLFYINPAVFCTILSCSAYTPVLILTAAYLIQPYFVLGVCHGRPRAE